MPLMPSSVAAAPRRRSLLTGALAAAGGATVSVGGVSGCSGGDSVDAENSAAARQLRASAAEQSEALLSRYERTAAAHGGLAERLKPLREAVVRHVSALRDSGTSGEPSSSPADPEAPPSDEPSASPGTSAAAREPKIPEERKAALAALASEEKRLAARRTKALDGAPPELARLLASLAAAGAAHAYLLGKDEKDGKDGKDGKEGQDGKDGEDGA